jgi:phenylalanyl-tRNA synthetase beta chain
MRTLDGVEREFDESMALVCDAEGPSGLAGIMGGQISEVSDKTTRVLMEAATWVGSNILKSSNKLQLRTEASGRFEKQLHPELGMAAQRLAARLMVDLCGARLVPGTIDAYPEPKQPQSVKLRLARVTKLIGVEVPEDEARGILERLGFGVSEAAPGEWDVAVPYWREDDVYREADVIEEIARFRLDEVPFTLPVRSTTSGALAGELTVRRLVEDVLVGVGFDEAYTWSLTADDPDPEALRIPLPLSSDMAVLRTTLLPSLAATARRNADHGAEDVALFEIARVYLPAGETLPDEHWRVAGVIAGGYARAKVAIDVLYAALKVVQRLERAEHELLHPGKTARLPEGWVGELRPGLLAGRWGAFELDLALLARAMPDRIRYEDVITFPAVRQDLAFAVPEEVTAAELAAVMREAAGPELRQVRPFDEYRSPELGAGRKSLAFAVAFQSPERTLTDEDAARLRTRIVEAVSARFGGELRA